jgi:hypothetical protein
LVAKGDYFRESDLVGGVVGAFERGKMLPAPNFVLGSDAT